MDIASMLEVEVQEVEDNEIKENGNDEDKKVTPSLKPHVVTKLSCYQYTKEENEFYKSKYGNDIASVRFERLHCTCCDEHIGSAPSEAYNIHEHPVLRVLLCAACRDFYGSGTFEQGEDNTDMWCRWCANGGQLYCCSYCSNTFCSKCIKRNFESSIVKRIDEDDKWKCFVCDPTDLFPARSLCRALQLHVKNVSRILENDKVMTVKEVEEKMHLDESKCCINKRKRRRRMSLSNDEDDEEYDKSFNPDKFEAPPAKKRKVRKSSTVKENPYSNGYVEHEYNSFEKSNETFEPDFTDLLIPCEQTLIEGDTEILSPNDLAPVNTKRINNHPQVLQSIPKPLLPVQNMTGLNPVPIANLLKVNLNTGKQKVKPVGKLIPVSMPMTVIPKSAARGTITLMKPQQISSIVPLKTLNNKKLPEEPSVIDLGSDDEPEIVDTSKTIKKKPISNNQSLNNKTVNKEKPIKPIENETKTTVESNENDNDIIELTIFENGTDNAVESQIPLEVRQRDQRFKKMLKLQSQEIDKTVSGLKTKILKLFQTSNTKCTQEADLLNSAASCTRRFNKAMRKTLVELSQINDRLVRDYVHWKKTFTELNLTELDNNKITSNSEKSDSVTLEMKCSRDSDSESEDDESETFLNLFQTPTEFNHILDHLTIFKKKVCAAKAVGDSSVLVDNKATQVYDVPCKDYEKCIGYSLLTKSEFDSVTQEEILKPVVMCDENFGKYQEQFIFHLQHIEDNGIEAEDEKGLFDANDLPEQNLPESTSPIMMDISEHHSPEFISNDSNSSLKNSQVLSPQTDMLDVSNLGNQEIESESSLDKIFENKLNEMTTTPENLDELMEIVTNVSNVINSENNDKNPLKNDEETAMAVKSLMESESIEKNNEFNNFQDQSVDNSEKI